MQPKYILKTINRRGFIKTTSALFAGTALNPSFASLGAYEPISSFGIVTDLHYADVVLTSSRF